jgi:hypothetical protein
VLYRVDWRGEMLGYKTEAEHEQYTRSVAWRPPDPLLLGVVYE